MPERNLRLRNKPESVAPWITSEGPSELSAPEQYPVVKPFRVCVSQQPSRHWRLASQKTVALKSRTTRHRWLRKPHLAILRPLRWVLVKEEVEFANSLRRRNGLRRFPGRRFERDHFPYLNVASQQQQHLEKREVVERTDLPV